MAVPGYAPPPPPAVPSEAIHSQLMRLSRESSEGFHNILTTLMALRTEQQSQRRCLETTLRCGQWAVAELQRTRAQQEAREYLRGQHRRRRYRASGRSSSSSSSSSSDSDTDARSEYTEDLNLSELTVIDEDDDNDDGEWEAASLGTPLEADDL